GSVDGRTRRGRSPRGEAVGETGTAGAPPYAKRRTKDGQGRSLRRRARPRGHACNHRAPRRPWRRGLLTAYRRLREALQHAAAHAHPAVVAVEEIDLGEPHLAEPAEDLFRPVA